MKAAGFILRALLAPFFFAPFAHAAEPAPLTLRFDFYYNDIRAADVVEVFTPQDGGGYTVESRAKAVGLAKLLYGDVVRKSAGRLDLENAGLKTLRYEEKRGKRARAVFMFDAENNVLRFQKGGETREEEIPDVVLTDYLTALYRPYVLQTVAAEKTAATNGWRLSFYEYAAGAPETVQTPLGEISAVPVSRESPRGERIFWLAPDLKYIPVKVFINDKGHKFTTVVTEINGGGLADFR